MPGVIVFGEASHGKWGQIYHCSNLDDLYSTCGEPTEGSLGLYWAIQALLKGKECLFWRVHEEALAFEDYHLGLSRLENLDQSSSLNMHQWQGLFLPNMSEPGVIDHALMYCHQSQKLLLMDPLDFQDWLMS